MRTTAIAIVAAGLVAALLLGVEYGLDAAGTTILVLLAAVGAVAIAVARKSGSRVTPAHCRECDGVISPHAPYCKHCGARAERPG